MKNILAFTIMEFMIVVVLMSVMASMALPSYFRTIEEQYEAQAQLQLQTIQNMMKIYYSKTGGYYPGNLDTTSDINDALGLSLIDDKMTFRCFSSAASYDCRATSTAYTWAVHIESPWSGGDPHCLSGSCPTCSFTACP